MAKLVTVIVPAFQVENYINKCLESVACQTYTNLEILVVDDGSDDNVALLCDYWSLIDQRITIIHKINGGLSDTRNYGIDCATGDYIGFVDSDDYIESDMYELLVSNMEKFQADVSCCRYANVYEDGIKEAIGDNHETYVYGGLDGLKEYLYGKVVDPFVCNKLYHAYYMRNNFDRAYSIRFTKGILGEDNPFNTEILKHTNRIVVAGESKYNYLQKRQGAITSAGVSQKKIDSVYWWDCIRQECHEKYPQLEKYALRRQVLFYVGLYNKIYGNKAFQVDQKKIMCFLKAHRDEIMKTDICEKLIKISVLLITTLPGIYFYMMKIYKKVFGSAERINA